MSQSDWWARKLAGQPAAGQPAVPAWPGAAQRPAAYPPTVHQAPPPEAYGAAPPASAQPPQQFFTFNADGQQVPDDGFVAQVHNAAAATGGSRLMKANNGQCPECLGNNYYQRTTTENGMPLRQPLAPRCFDCGYPFIQAGSMHGGATMTGGKRGGVPPKPSRQLPANHEVSVVLENGATMIYPAVG